MLYSIVIIRLVYKVANVPGCDDNSDTVHVINFPWIPFIFAATGTRKFSLV